MAAKLPKAISDMQLTAVRTLTSVLAAPSLQASVSGSTATLSWTPPVPTGQSVIAGYRVYKGTTAGSQSTLIATTTATSLPDTLSGTQFYRVEAFDQYQTGNSSVPVGCVPQGNVFRFANAVGHYYRNNSYHFDAAAVSSVTTVLNALQSKVTGVCMSGYAQYFDNGTSGPNYVWTQVDTILANCAAKGKQFIFQLADRNFTTTSGSIAPNTFPPWWITAGYCAAADGNGCSLAKVWDLNYTNNAWIPFWQAFGARYKDNTSLAQVQIGGESVLLLGGISSAQYSQYYKNLKSVAAATRAALPYTLIHVMVDYVNAVDFATTALQLQDLLTYFKSLGGISVGGPDPAGPGPTSTAGKDPTVNEVYQGNTGGIDYRAVLMFRSQIEALFQNINASTPENIFTLAQNTVNPQIMIWTDVSSWSSIQTKIQNGTLPATRATAPSDNFQYDGGPQAPADFFVTLQGQTAQNSSIFNPSSPPSFNIPNEGSISFGWLNAVQGPAPIAHYEMQVSTNGGSTWTTPTGGASISTAAPNAQGTRFKDAQCPNCVGSTYGPTNGQYLTATQYLHRLRAVDTQGNVSPWVTGAKQYIFNGLTGGMSVGTPSGGSGSAGGGLKWGGDLSSAYPTNYAVSDPTYGFVATIDMSAATGGYFLPTTGCNYCTYNQQVGSCDYIYFLLKTTNAAINIVMHGEVVGDLKMRPGGAPAANLFNGLDLILSKYVAGGTVIANTYQLYQVPLADFMTPTSTTSTDPWIGSVSALGVRELTLYKFLWQGQAPGIVTLAKAWVGK